MPTEFYFKIHYFNFDWKVKRQTQISVIQSQNQQQPIVHIQHLFQRSSQLECSPV